MEEVKHTTLEDIKRSFDGKTVGYGDPIDVAVRMINALEDELQALHERIETLENMMGI